MKSKTGKPATLVTTKEAANLLGVTPQTIKNYIYTGKLTSHRTPGGHHRLKVSDLEELAPQKGDLSREELMEQYDQLYRDYMDTIEALLNAVDGRDGIISGHSRRVADYACFGEVKFLREITPYIRHHHERFDGQGYPDGLSGESIPLEAKVIFIAEAFDSLTSETSYHPTMDLKEAYAEMERGAGTQFDREILRIFLDTMDQNPTPTA